MKEKNISEIRTNLKGFPVHVVNLTIELLYVEDFTTKHNARLSLVKMGKKIIPSMHKLLSTGNAMLRMEVVKVVELIADKRSIPFLITLLADPEFDIRWVASQGLIRIGRKSIKPLLDAICGEKNSLFLDKSAHHILGHLLHEDEKLQLEPLMLSLDNYHETGETAPVEAFKALKMFRFNN